VTEASGAETQRDDLFRARRRGLVALAGTLALVVAIFVLFRGTLELSESKNCSASSDCDGFLGVECLHAPAGNYCTHSCNRNEDCDKTFHCDSPPWEHDATHLVCLRGAPPAK
jgi:hypothetical protein